MDMIKSDIFTLISSTVAKFKTASIDIFHARLVETISKRFSEEAAEHPLSEEHIKEHKLILNELKSMEYCCRSELEKFMNETLLIWAMEHTGRYDKSIPSCSQDNC